MEGWRHEFDRNTLLSTLYREHDIMPSHLIVTRTLEQDADEVRRRSEENIRKYRERQQIRAEKNEAARRKSYSSAPHQSQSPAPITLKEKPLARSSSVPDTQFIYDTQAKWRALLKKRNPTLRGDATTRPV